MKIGIQVVLDQLNDEHAIPFKLTAHKVDDLGDGNYAIRFYAPRLHSIILSSRQGSSVRDKVRDAVMEVFAPGTISVTTSTGAIQPQALDSWEVQSPQTHPDQDTHQFE